MDIDFRKILKYLEQYANKEYKSPEKAFNEKEKTEMMEIKGAATPAVNEFKKIAKYFKQIGFTANEGTIKWLDASNVKVRSYIWLELKKPNKEKYQSSISIFAEKVNYDVRFRVTLELKEMGCKEEDYLRHHRFLDILDISKNDFQYFGSRKVELDLLLLNESEVIEAIKKIKNKELNKLQIGKIISKSELDNNSSSEVLNIIRENVRKLEPFYNKAVEEDGDDPEIVNIESVPIKINPEKNITTEFSTDEIISKIESYIKAKNFLYSYPDLANFYLSLKTKPFVILAGISGTGKSKIVRLFAEAIGANVNNGRYKMISVKPDWNDSTELFGYKNINDEFIPGQLTEIIKEAVENRILPYFVCIDEMNLARVEYYLSEYLSLIESRNVQGNEIVTDHIFSSNYINNDYSKLYIPENLYIIGTVNMDDTTFQFSRKVLDRANTIEFSEVNLDKLFVSNEEADEAALENVNNDFLKTSYLNINDIEEQYREYAAFINTKIVSINDILKKARKNFAYRVRDEIIFYMVENKKLDLMAENIAFDYQIMQKILPAISGSESVIKDILVELFNFCLGKEAVFSDASYLEDAESFLKDAVYSKSASKILDMLRGYKYDGFATYWF